MNYDFLEWFRALNPVARVSLTILAASLVVLILVGIIFSIRAIVRAVKKKSKAAAKGLIQGLEKAQAKVEASKSPVEANLNEAKLKITAAFAMVKQKLHETFHEKPFAPTAPVAPVPESADSVNLDVRSGASVPEDENKSTIGHGFEFSEEKLPQYCAHCGMQFTETMLHRVSHNMPAFCGRCGMKYTPSSGPSYQKLVDEVLQP